MEKKKLKLSISGTSKKTINSIEQAKPQSKNAVLIEKQLCKIVDSNDWSIFAHLLIDHGRKACIANRPRCFECVISSHCPSVS